MTPEIDVAAYLNNTVDDLTSATNLFYGAVFPVSSTVPSEAVFVMLSGGASPQSFAGTHTHAEYPATVQIYVRGDKSKYADTVALARAVYNALRFASITGYIDCKPMQAGPIPLGLDKDGHHALSINYELKYDE